jgi:virginiamycin B lyase
MERLERPDPDPQPKATTPGELVLELVLEAQVATPPLSARDLLEAARAMQAVVCIDLPKRGITGTGVLIGPRLLMTCKHVLPTDEDVQQASYIFHYRVGESETEGESETRSYHADPRHAPWRSGRWDCMVVRLESAVELHETPIALSATGPSVDERVHLIHHPFGLDKQLEPNVPVTFVSEEEVGYLAATRPGSSGAPVFNRAWQMVALHRASVTFQQSGLLLQRVRSVGIPIQAMRADLPREVSEHLSSSAAPTLVSGERTRATTGSLVLTHPSRLPVARRSAISSWFRVVLQGLVIISLLSALILAITAIAHPGRSTIPQTAVRQIPISEFSLPRLPVDRTWSVVNLTVGSDGNIWLEGDDVGGDAGDGHYYIGRMTPSGAATAFPVPSGNAGVREIVGRPDRNLWFTEFYDHIGCITPAGAMHEFAVSTPATQSPRNPSSITVGPDGNIWFSELSVSRLGRMIPTCADTPTQTPPRYDEFPVTTRSSPGSLTSGPDGNIWFLEAPGNGSWIGEFSPASGTLVRECPLISAGDQAALMSLIQGTDGNLWFADYNQNKIGKITVHGKGGSACDFEAQEYPIRTPNAHPYKLTPGPDGNIWFTEQTANQIGRIAPDGVITEFALPSADKGSQLVGITSGPLGSIWFAVKDSGRIAALTPPSD